MHRFTPRRRSRWTAVAGLAPALALVCSGAAAQDADWSVLEAGRLRIGVVGEFTSGDGRFDSEGRVLALASDLRVANAASIFPGIGGLTTQLREILGDPGFDPSLGPMAAYFQSSRVRVPFTAELGVTRWLTLGVTVPLVKSRVEGDWGLVPSAADNLGVNPAFTRYSDVRAFTDALAAAAGALTGPEADLWGAWALRWVHAYAASAVFPAAGTSTGDALIASLDAFNAVLAGAGVPLINAPVPLAAAVLDQGSFAALMSDPSAHFQFLPLPSQLLWTLGDVEIHGRVRILEGGGRTDAGRPAFGLTGLGSVRLPTGAGDETRAIYDLPMGEGVLGYSAGAAAWIRGGRVGVGAMARYGISATARVPRRIGPPDVPLVPVTNLAVLEHTPGSTVEVEVRPSFSVAPALTLEGFYQYFRKGRDSYSATAPALGAPAELIPYPSGALYSDPDLLAEGTEGSLQLAGGGLRYHPPQDAFPVEIWVNAQVAVGGSGRDALKEMRLAFGGRATWRLWGSPP